MKTYRSHYCDKTHRNYKTLAKCLWPRAAWRAGDGPYALVAKCRRGNPTITMHQDPGAAEQTARDLDAVGCGATCRRDHELIELAVAA